jgi:hypothetical protein
MKTEGSIAQTDRAPLAMTQVNRVRGPSAHRVEVAGSTPARAPQKGSDFVGAFSLDVPSQIT